MAATQVVMAEQGMGHPAVPWDGAPPKRKWRSKSTQPKYQMYSAIFQKGVKEPRLGPSRFKGSQKKKGLKARKFHDHRGSVPWTVPRAPFNDSSFLMQVRKCGGLAPVFPSPTISSYDFGSYQDLLDLEDYGYGSMTGLIRLRRVENDGDEWGGASTVVNDPDVINMCEVEQRLPSSPADSLERLEQRIDRGVSRFEIRGAAKQDRRIQDLQDENLLLKHRLLLMFFTISTKDQLSLRSSPSHVLWKAANAQDLQHEERDFESLCGHCAKPVKVLLLGKCSALPVLSDLCNKLSLEGEGETQRIFKYVLLYCIFLVV